MSMKSLNCAYPYEIIRKYGNHESPNSNFAPKKMGRIGHMYTRSGISRLRSNSYMVVFMMSKLFSNETGASKLQRQSSYNIPNISLESQDFPFVKHVAENETVFSPNNNYVWWTKSSAFHA